jgi:hypothetical protein
MLRYYGMKTLADYLVSRPNQDFQGLIALLDSPEPADGAPRDANGRDADGRDADGRDAGNRVREWVNLGGQIVPAARVDALRRRIREGEIQTWEAVHRAYDEMAAAYPLDRLRHAWETLRCLSGEGGEHPWARRDFFKQELGLLRDLRRRIAEGVYRSRAKDFHDPFRGITYRSKAEMEEVAGNPENNAFVVRTRAELREFETAIDTLLARL